MWTIRADHPRGDFTPWRRISTDTYFWWEAAFIAPVIVGSGLLAGACMYLFAPGHTGIGSSDDTLAPLGPAVAACTGCPRAPPCRSDGPRSPSTRGSCSSSSAEARSIRDNGPGSGCLVTLCPVGPSRGA